MSRFDKDQVEQYRAQDRSPEWISKTTGLTVAQVQRIFKAQDTTLTEETIPNADRYDLPRVEECRKGHPRTPENTIVRGVNGWRDCRVCKKRRDATRIRPSLYENQLQASIDRHPAGKQRP